MFLQNVAAIPETLGPLEQSNFSVQSRAEYSLRFFVGFGSPWEDGRNCIPLGRKGAVLITKTKKLSRFARQAREECFHTNEKNATKRGEWNCSEESLFRLLLDRPRRRKCRGGIQTLPPFPCRSVNLNNGNSVDRNVFNPLPCRSVNLNNCNRVDGDLFNPFPCRSENLNNGNSVDRNVFNPFPCRSVNLVTVDRDLFNPFPCRSVNLNNGNGVDRHVFNPFPFRSVNLVTVDRNLFNPFPCRSVNLKLYFLVLYNMQDVLSNRGAKADSLEELGRESAENGTNNNSNSVVKYGVSPFYTGRMETLSMGPSTNDVTLGGREEPCSSDSAR
ncbi:hypothetical protein AVEN_16684-1 [Araneus ventricosus]|uniref:Uncharacterized protein n=1 Tax=Araneus ventricosus TaxID=182803 RepID=A0A4Y2SUG1_ARAVE|nr:hypothetical protein AVEN_16684-1 [Araneus ventricosus]